MQPLSGIDEMFISLDTSRTIGHIAGIGILHKTDGSQAHTLGFVRTPDRGTAGDLAAVVVEAAQCPAAHRRAVLGRVR